MGIRRGSTAALMLGIVLAFARPATGQSPPASAPSDPNRVVWTLIGGGIGFGGGVLTGLALFDDAVHGERKAWTTAAIGAVAGGVAGNLLSGRAGPRASRRPTDPLWNGMAIGAAAGGVVGLWYVPATNCNTQTNPECPGILRLVVGLPAIAGGAALGAWVDRLSGARVPGPVPAASASRSRTVVLPLVAPGTVGFVYSRSF